MSKNYRITLTKYKTIVYKSFRRRVVLYFKKSEFVRKLTFFKYKTVFFFKKRSLFSNKVRVSIKSIRAIFAWFRTRVRKKYFKIKKTFWGLKRRTKVRNKKFLYIDVYCRGFKFYRKKSSKRIYNLFKTKKEVYGVFLPYKARTQKILRAGYAVKLYTLVKRVENLKITCFFYFSKNILESMVVERQREVKEESYIFLTGKSKEIKKNSFYDSDVDLYLGDVVWFDPKWSRIFFKGALIKKNLKLYRGRAQDVQRMVRRYNSSFVSKQKVLFFTAKGVAVCFKNIRKLALRTWLCKNKTKEDWYETWENLFSVIDAITRVNERERSYKERGKKIQDIKKNKIKIAE